MSSEQELRDEARRWVRRKRIFYSVVGIYLALSLMWFAIDLLDDSSGYWFYWPMLGTGVAVLVTGVRPRRDRRSVRPGLGATPDRETSRPDEPIRG